MGRVRPALVFVVLALCCPGVAQAAGDRYVALGDSYTSGPLIPNQHGDPIDCGRSDHNYPSLTAPALSVGTFTDVSCGSAETKDMTAPQTGLPAGGTNPPQFNALRPDTTLVTVGIGGNDAGLVGVAEECAQLGATHPTGTACRDHYAPGGKDTVAAKIDSAKPKVAAVLQGIHQRSPQARVAIVGYPDVAPKSGNCYPMVPLSSDDMRYIDELIIRINAMIAGQAAANDAEYVDTYADSIGHDVCKLPPDRWFEGLAPTEPAYPLHPNAKGEATMARSVIKVLSRPRPTRPRNGLLVGPTRGMRHARPRHPFRVRVRARGATLRRVQVVLRDARGRRVGASKRFTLTAKRRLPAVKVSRRVRSGRYRVTAAGRTAAGALVKGTRRIRIK
jgi:lysophospholipase L1-like esterase